MALILIKKLGTRVSKSDRLESWGKFLCSFCGKEIEKRLNDAKKCKSCGCSTKRLISESKKGKLRTEELKLKVSKANKGKLIGKNNPNYNKKGEEHPAFGYKHSKKNRLKFSKINKGKIVSEETRQKQSKIRIDSGLSKGKNNPMYGVHRYGKDNPNWNNGSSFEPYSPEFNKPLKQRILERDNYTCQEPNCLGKHKKLHVHHIDYDKTNNNLENFITLCIGCHIKTNSKNKRIYYTKFYSEIVSVYL